MEPGLLQVFDAPMIDAVRDGARLAADGLGARDGWLILAQAAGDTAVESPTTVAGQVQPTFDFSLWAIISRADTVVQVVIGILVFASVWSWAIIFDKLMLVGRLNRRADRFEEGFWSGGSVDDLYERISDNPRDPMSAMFVAAMREWHRSGASDNPGAVRPGVKDRIEKVMQVVLGREMDRAERFTGFLATVGNTAPFVGLFGTVWGIMNSFQDIALERNTNLATVAPGISEALLATALGLIAAIPAVVAYNKFIADFDRFAHRLEGFQTEFGAIVSRQLDAGGE